MVNSWNCAYRKRPLSCTAMPTKKRTCLAKIQFATHATTNLWFSVRSLLSTESAMANIVICADGTWNRPEENLQKDFPTNVLIWLAPMNPVTVCLNSRFL